MSPIVCCLFRSAKSASMHFTNFAFIIIYMENLCFLSWVFIRHPGKSIMVFKPSIDDRFYAVISPEVQSIDYFYYFTNLLVGLSLRLPNDGNNRLRYIYSFVPVHSNICEISSLARAFIITTPYKLPIASILTCAGDYITET